MCEGRDTGGGWHACVTKPGGRRMAGDSEHFQSAR